MFILTISIVMPAVFVTLYKTSNKEHKRKAQVVSTIVSRLCVGWSWDKPIAIESKHIKCRKVISVVFLYPLLTLIVCYQLAHIFIHKITLSTNSNAWAQWIVTKCTLMSKRHCVVPCIQRQLQQWLVIDWECYGIISFLCHCHCHCPKTSIHSIININTC